MLILGCILLLSNNVMRKYNSAANNIDDVNTNFGRYMKYNLLLLLPTPVLLLMITVLSMSMYFMEKLICDVNAVKNAPDGRGYFMGRCLHGW